MQLRVDKRGLIREPTFMSEEFKKRNADLLNQINKYEHIDNLRVLWIVV